MSETCFENSPVRSYTEWDPLEEVIVGIVDDASFPPWHPSLEPVLRSTFGVVAYEEHILQI